MGYSYTPRAPSCDFKSWGFDSLRVRMEGLTTSDKVINKFGTSSAFMGDQDVLGFWSKGQKSQVDSPRQRAVTPARSLCPDQGPSRAPRAATEWQLI